MKLSMRYGFVGMGALALLSLVHWRRGLQVSHPPVVDYLLGVLPNFAAAIAITFVMLSVWADQNRDPAPGAALRPFLGCALVSGLGLVAWEFFQKTSRKLVFDPHDLAATFIGLGVSALLFAAVTPMAGGARKNAGR